jgi:hypothetical protein
MHRMELIHVFFSQVMRLLKSKSEGHGLEDFSLLASASFYFLGVEGFVRGAFSHKGGFGPSGPGGGGCFPGS